MTQNKNSTQMKTVQDIIDTCLIRMPHFAHRTDREPLLDTAFKAIGIKEHKGCLVPPIDPTTLDTNEYRYLHTPATLSCAITKSNCMKEAYEMNKPLLFLEDDVVFHPQIEERMNNVLEKLPANWKILYLGWVEDCFDKFDWWKEPAWAKTELSVTPYKRLQFPVWHHALLIRCPQCLKEIAHYIASPATYRQFRDIGTCDRAMAKYCADNGIPMYGCNPVLAVQAPGYSDRTGTVETSERTFIIEEALK